MRKLSIGDKVLHARYGWGKIIEFQKDFPVIFFKLKGRSEREVKAFMTLLRKEDIQILLQPNEKGIFKKTYEKDKEL